MEVRIDPQDENEIRKAAKAIKNKKASWVELIKR